MNLIKQRIMYKIDLPVNFQTWNEFYDELVRLGLIQPTIDIIQIRIFAIPTASHTMSNKDSSLVQHLVYERKYIDQMCLAELRQSRTESAGNVLTADEITDLIQLVSNQATQLKHWDLLVKLNNQLRVQQVRAKDSISYRTVPGH